MPPERTGLLIQCVIIQLKAHLNLLRCPVTGQRLVHKTSECLATEDGMLAYPVVDGVPVLVADGRALFSSSEIARSADRSASQPRSWPARLVSRLSPSTSLNPGAASRYRNFRTLVTDGAPRRQTRVLVIGGGKLGRGLEQLTRAGDLELLETDIYISDRVDVACDAHDLPFPDESFDGVIAQAVLEHVVAPARVVSEMHRILRPEGVVYAETPFMQQVHEGAFDFSRFTDLGHRRLFRMFTEVDRGLAVGPATALLWSIRYFLRSLPRRSRSAALALDKVVNLAFGWFKYLDYVLLAHPGAMDAAGGFYFVGRKATSCFSDTELINSYRGLERSVVTARGLRGRDPDDPSYQARGLATPGSHR